MFVANPGFLFQKIEFPDKSNWKVVAGNSLYCFIVFKSLQSLYILYSIIWELGKSDSKMKTLIFIFNFLLTEYIIEIS